MIVEVGVKFVILFGVIEELLMYVVKGKIVFVFGMVILLDMMKVLELGYDYLKFFLVEVNGGVVVLKVILVVLL